MRIKCLILTIALSTVVAAPKTDAQDRIAPSEVTPPASSPVPVINAVSVTDEDVAAFADALYAAMEVDEAWRPRMAAARTDDEAAQLNQ